MGKNFKKHLIGTAGELAVANMLCLQGWVPSLTSNNCPSFDVFGYDPEFNKSCVIQVKTTKDEKGYSSRKSFQLGFTHEKRDEWIAGLTCPYVFVHIDLENIHTFYILSAADLEAIVIKTDDDYFNKGRSKPLNPTYPVAIELKYIMGFKDKWGNLWV